MRTTVIKNQDKPLWRLLVPGILLIITITLLIAYSYQWNITNLDQNNYSLALSEARSNWQKDAVFRKWATRHGGLYVKPDERTPPNPALVNLPDRDIVTTDGTKLTLMNPAYMMRQMTGEFEEMYGVKGKITGKVQIQPGQNVPDEWETEALNQFEKNADLTEMIEQTNIGDLPYLRYMRPMYMTEGCVKCHGFLGFNDGDLRGGVSVSIPMKPYFDSAGQSKYSMLVTHITIWFFAVVSILLFMFVLNRFMNRISHEIMHDGLTSLPNLRLFKNRLEQAINKHRRITSYFFAVCFLDIDRFKNMNDSLGHHAGDQLLIAAAARFRKVLRPGDTVARMGGDEYTFLLDDVTDIDGALTIAERIHECLKEPFEISNEKIYINASMGLCFSDDKYRNPNEMIRDADIAMYRAKALGKGRIDVFNLDMREYASETMLIENQLQQALSKNQLEVYYQPVVDIENSRIKGFEALLRWKHPELGQVSPERFIPVAEHSGQINKIGLWVLEQACLQTRDWNLQFGNGNPFSISVNLSGVQLANENITEEIREVLTKTRFDASALNMEVTETILVGQTDIAQKATDALRDMGISLSIDDFGKGFCSLTYLQSFDFDTLKIDKDFVQDMDGGGKGLQLVRTLMLLARDLKMDVIAEGVEEADQLNRLSALRCPYVQGYYFSKPLPAIQITALLEQGCHLDSNKLLHREVVSNGN